MKVKKSHRRSILQLKPLFLLFFAMILMCQPFVGIGSIHANTNDSFLKIGSMEGKRGETVSLPVSLSSQEQLKALQFDLAYNPEFLTLVGVRKGDIQELELFANVSNGKVMMGSFESTLPMNQETVIAYLDFQIRQDTSLTSSTVEMRNPVAANGEARDITANISFVSGQVSLPLEGPVILGVEQGKQYASPVTPTVLKPADVANTTLLKNGVAVPGYLLGTAIDQSGSYELTVVNQNGLQATVQFTLDLAAKLTGISLNLYQYVMEEGQSQTVTVTANYSNGAVQTVTSQASYSVGSTAIATVGTDGMITGIKKGTTFLKVTYGGFSANASIEILPRTLSSDAQLQSLGVSKGVLSPSFVPGITNYKVSVPNGSANLSIQAVPKDPKATMTVNDIPTLSGQSVVINLTEDITTVKIVVTAENQASSSTYTVQIKRVTQEFEDTRIIFPEDNSTIIYNQPVVAGVSEKQSKVEVFIDGVSAGTAWTGLDGSWSTVSSLTLTDDVHQVTAVAVDNFGNRKISPVVHFTVDTSSTLTLETNPSAVEGDGISKISLKATLKARNGDPIRDTPVEFSVQSGKLSSEDPVLTNENGEALATLTAPKIDGILPKQELIKARVEASGGAYKENSIMVSYLPASIKGIVYDYKKDTDGKVKPFPVAGALVELKEDFNQDGIIDFTGSVKTGSNGEYKIYVPQGDWTYTPIISFPKMVGNTEIPVKFEQKAELPPISTNGKIFPSNPTVSGLLLMPDPTNPGAAPKPIKEVLKGNETVDTKVLDEEGNSIDGLELNEDGTFEMKDVPAGTYELVVKVKAADGITELCAQSVTVTVSQGQGELSFQVMLIDPYGVVSDRVTGEPIKKVKMSLYWADTQLNLDNRKVPDTLVPLPELPEFQPNKNLVPQWTNDAGQYAWMVFPHGDYYLIAEKEGYVTFDSRKDTRNEQHGLDSWIKDGIIHVGNSIVKYDLQMEPIDVPSKGGSSSGPPIPEPPVIPTPSLGEPPYIVGYKDQTFRPNNPLTRAEMATILSRIVDREDIESKDSPYPDVPTTHWASDAIRFAQVHQLMIGYPDGQFKPEEHISRAEMAAVAVRIKNLTVNGETSNFPDTKLHWADSTIQTAWGANLMVGYPDGTFRPNAMLTRAEAVTVFNHLLGRKAIAIPEKPTFLDVERSYWAFEEIEAAATVNAFQEFHP